MKAKKVVISLGIALTAALAVVVGVLMFNKGGKTEPQIFAQPHNQGLISEEFKPITYYFDEGEVRMAKGSDRLVYSYDVNQTATAPVAYEYVFKNASSTEMAVNVKEINVTGVTVSYQWSDTELAEITQSESHFITQPISTNGTKYLYVVLSPESEDESVVVNTDVKWNYGEAGTLTKIHTVSGLPFTQTYIKNIPINEEDMLLPNMEEGYAFGGWYWDADYVQPVQFPLEYTGKQMYARVGSPLPDDWFGKNTSSSSYPYYGKYGVTISGTSIHRLKTSDIIIPEVHNGNQVETITVALTGASNVKIPGTVKYLGAVLNDDNKVRKILIPKSVAWMGFTFRNCPYLEEVIFEEGSQLTTIYSYAFEQCEKLTSITIPDSVTGINTDVFKGSGIRTINIPKNVITLSKGLFQGCKNLASVTFEEGSKLTSIGQDMFSGCSSLTSINIPEGVRTLYSSAFSSCSSLISITIPSSVISIGSSTFSYCSSLTEITIPASVTTIESSVFSNCSNLTTVTFEPGCQITTIPSDTFWYCSKLEGITIPAGVQTIKTRAFDGCTSLSRLEFEPNSKLKRIEDEAFGAATSSKLGNEVSLTGDLVIPASVEYIGDLAFSDKISSVTFEPGSQLREIGYRSFYECTELTEIEIPDTVTTIGIGAFTSCISLKSIKLPAGLTGILDLTACRNLRNIDIPEGVTEVAFPNCYSLQNVNLPNGLTTLRARAFSGTKIESINIPASVTSIGENAFGTSTLKEINFEPGFKPKTIANSVFSSKGSIINLYDWDFLSEVETIGTSAFQNCTEITGHLTLPATLTSISGNSFAGCTGITGISVADDNAKYDSRGNCNAVIETATNKLVMGCGLTVIPEDIAQIGDYAFYNCKNLTSTTIPNSATSIGKYAFYGCTILTDITIPRSVTSIGQYAFSNSGIINAWIPNTVTSLGSESFYQCPNLISGVFEENSPLTALPGNIFRSSPNLTYVNLGKGSKMTSIPGWCFDGAKKLTTIVISDNITSIANYAFQGCSNLKTVYNLSSLNITAGSSDYGYVGYYATNIYTSLDDMPDVDEPGVDSSESSIEYTEQDGEVIVTGYTGTPTDVVLDSRTTKIADKVFYACKSITSITIPASVTAIGNQAFYQCPNLASVTFEEGSQLVTIGYDSFYSCDSLISVNLEKCLLLTTIGSTAFCSCDNLMSIVIPVNVTTMNIQAFDYCYRLYTVYDLSTKLNITKGSSSNGHVGKYAKEVLYSLDEPSAMIDIDGIRYYNNGTNLAAVGVLDMAITTAVLKEGIVEIPARLFKNCTKLTNVTIPSSVTTIGNDAFYGCVRITSVDLPDGIEMIGEGAFYGTGITTINLPKNIKQIGSAKSSSSIYEDDAVFGNKLQGKLVIPASVTTIGFCAFYNCVGITEIEFESGIKLDTIYGYAFRGLSNLKSVTLPASLQSIGTGVFYECTSLTNIVLPKGLTTIGSSAFYNCALTNVVFPDSLTTIGGSAFYGCELSKLVLPDKLTTIGAGAFRGNYIGGPLVIPASVTEIGGSAFYNNCFSDIFFEANSNCKTIGAGAFSANNSNTLAVFSITIPASVETIGKEAFHLCNNLKYLSFEPNSKLKTIEEYAFSGTYGGCNIVGDLLIPASVESIGKGAFNGADITSLTFEDGSKLTKIGDSAFASCTQLRKVSVFPSTLTTIGASAFNGCSNLNMDLVIPATLTSIGVNAFYACANLTGEIIIPASLTSIGGGAFGGCTGITGISVDSNNTVYDSRNNCNAIIKTATNELVLACNATIIPSDITSIGSYAFYGCTGLTGELIIPSSVTSIGASAFTSCSKLTSVRIPAGVTSIGNYAFTSCSNLTSVTFGEESQLTRIGERAFYGCSKLSSITIPSGVTSIESLAFYLNDQLYIVYNFSSLDIVAGSSSYGYVGYYAKAVYTALPTIVGDFKYVEQDDDFILAQYLGNATEVVLDSRVTKIGGGAFYKNKTITSISIPSGVTTIGRYAFYECSNLTNVDIKVDSQLTSIETYAFYGCTKINTLLIPKGVTSLGDNLFISYYNTPWYIYNLSSLNITKGSSSYGYIARNARAIYTSAPIDINGVLYVEQDGEFIATAYIGDGGAIVLDPRTTAIGIYAFYGCSKLTSITIPASVKTIGTYAFYGCSGLTSVTFEKESLLTTIGTYAFYGCSKLTRITIPANVTSIGTYAFYSCSNLSLVTFEVTEGWTAGTTTLTSTNLYNRSTAAQYLRSTHYSKAWTRS